MPRFISLENRQKIVKKYEENKTQAAIAAELGVSVVSVRKYLREAGVDLDSVRRYRVYTEDQVAQACKMYLDGKRTPEIARSMGLPHASTAYSLLKRGGVAARRGHGSKVPDGATKKTSEGYIMVKVPRDWAHHPGTAGSGGDGRWRFQHRVVMSEHLGRSLTAKEQVHHINGVRDDNRIENLELRSGSHGSGVKLCCRSCGSSDIDTVALG